MRENWFQEPREGRRAELGNRPRGAGAVPEADQRRPKGAGVMLEVLRKGGLSLEI